ncbi:MAG: nitroreductase family protein [Bacteroidetes bacterium]|nr:nitroreductase family protein [Bacteroidota bacterium]
MPKLKQIEFLGIEFTPPCRDELPSLARKNSRWQGSTEIPEMEKSEKRRNLSEGYRRGWMLQNTSLYLKIEQNPLFNEAYEKAQGVDVFSILPKQRMFNLFLMITEGLLGLENQNIIEFGSYKGGTAIFFSVLLNRLSPNSKVFALDTFEGIPTSDSALDLHKKGDFADCSRKILEQRCSELGITNLMIIQGKFQDTFMQVKNMTESFGLVHIDCDTYSSVSFAQEAVWPNLCTGAYLVYDDADSSSCLGATQAMEEMIISHRIHCEQAWPHFVFRKESQNVMKSLTNGIFNDILQNRRQTRLFKTDPVSKDILDSILLQMHGAPSVGNCKPWRIVEIKSPQSLLLLKENYFSANKITKSFLPKGKVSAYNNLNLEGFLSAPIQLSVFTETKPSAGFRQGWATFPDALKHSTISAIHTLWLAAINENLGFAWNSTFYAKKMEEQFARSGTWEFTAHVSIGFPAEKLLRPRHEITGFQEDQKLERYEV